MNRLVYYFPERRDWKDLPSQSDGVLHKSKGFIMLPSARYNFVVSDKGRGFPQETLPSIEPRRKKRDRSYGFLGKSTTVDPPRRDA